MLGLFSTFVFVFVFVFVCVFVIVIVIADVILYPMHYELIGSFGMRSSDFGHQYLKNFVFCF